MKRIICLLTNLALVAALSFVLAAPAAAQQGEPSSDDGQILTQVDSDVIEQTLLLLSSYHDTPDRALFERVHPQIDDILYQIAIAPSGFDLYQDRALAALSQWPNTDVFDLYVDRLNADDTSEITRHRVIALLAYTFPETSVDVVMPYLQADDVQYRLSAIAALQQMGTTEAINRLELAVENEMNPTVLERLETALTIAR